MKNIILGLLSLIGFLIVLGSAGAWSNGNITLLQCLIQSAIGVGTAWLSLKNMNI